MGAQFDFLVKGGNLYKGGGVLEEEFDVAVAGGKIAAVEKNIPEEAAKQTVDAQGKLLSPAFLDTHMHIDESFTMQDDDTLSLLAAIDNQNKCNAKYFDWTRDQLVEMMVKNAGRVVEMCIANGTTLLKTNVLFLPAWGTAALEAMMELRRRYKGRCDILTCCGAPPHVAKELERAALCGEIDFVGGYPYMDEDYWNTLDAIFARAARFGLPVDVHCGESDVPNIDCFLYLLQKTAGMNMYGRVTCGHLTSLSAHGLPEEEAAKALALAAEVRLNVTSLTSCNLYLSSMNRRGPTRVRQLMDAGVNVAVASDNIRDTFRPYGNCDLLAEALLAAKVNRLGHNAGLRQAFDMVTYNAAKNALLPDYGLYAGAPASMVLLNAPTPEEALRSQVEKRMVWKNGRVVAEQGRVLPAE